MPQPASEWKVLIASHSHPELSKGGAEIAAFELFRALKKRPDYKTWFLGCVRDQFNSKLGATISQPFSDREFLYSAGAFDWFKFANRDPNFPREFRDLLSRLQPDIVHFHHYINLGVESFLHVRETLPHCKIIVTLHEYLALCHHFGQMLTKSRSLCYESSPVRCTRCFTDITPADFFLRNLYINRFFDLVDRFIAPSQFLAERYISWGVPEARMSVIENVIAHPQSKHLETTATEKSDLWRIGFFGQISFLKGINVMLEAAAILEDREIDHVVFEIYGDYTGQPPDFQKEFLERMEKSGRNVKFHGPYDQQRVDRLMQSVDLVIVPSIWWENSPVVIQEALRNRRAIICSDIGGMAEKVRDGIDGYHFAVGNSLALASLLMRLTKTRSKVIGAPGGMRSPASVEEMTERYHVFYESLAVH